MQTTDKGERYYTRINKTLKLKRSVGCKRYPLLEVFKNLDKIPVVRRILNKKTLENLLIRFVDKDYYMWVDDTTGEIIIGRKYFASASKIIIYLDILHELVHVRQYFEGKNLYDRKYPYVDRPTEIEAYRISLREAKKLELSSKKIIEYLSVDWISERDLARLAINIGLNIGEIKLKNEK